MEPSARVPLMSYIIFAALAALGGGADLITKELVFRHFGLPGQQPTWWLLEGHLGIQTSLNPGALFGLGEGKRLIFAALSIVALVAIVIWLFVYRAAKDRVLTICLGCICGGILGNLYDRLGLWHPGGLPAGIDPKYTGAVRDWILFQWKEFPLAIFDPWPNFNIADSLLVCGAIAIAVHAFLYREKKPAGEVSQTG